MDPIEPMERTEPTNVDERSTPQVTSVPKKSKAPKVLGVLLVLALIGCGALGWMAYDQNGQKASLGNKVKAKDEQITQLKSQLKVVKATSENTSTDNTSTDTSNSDSEMIIKAALAYSNAYVTLKKGTLSAEVSKQAGGFAQVTITSSAAAGLSDVYLKKVGTEWVVIGNGIPDRGSLEQLFGLPKDF